MAVVIFGDFRVCVCVCECSLPETLSASAGSTLVGLGTSAGKTLGGLGRHVKLAAASRRCDANVGNDDWRRTFTDPMTSSSVTASVPWYHAVGVTSLLVTWVALGGHVHALYVTSSVVVGCEAVGKSDDKDD